MPPYTRRYSAPACAANFHGPAWEGSYADFCAMPLGVFSVFREENGGGRDGRNVPASSCRVGWEAGGYLDWRELMCFSASRRSFTRFFLIFLSLLFPVASSLCFSLTAWPMGALLLALDACKQAAGQPTSFYCDSTSARRIAYNVAVLVVCHRSIHAVRWQKIAAKGAIDVTLSILWLRKRLRSSGRGSLTSRAAACMSVEMYIFAGVLGNGRCFVCCGCAAAVAVERVANRVPGLAFGECGKRHGKGTG